jgi:hypothetical protein
MTQETQETYRKSSKPFRYAVQVKLKPMLRTESPGKEPLTSGNSWDILALVLP